MKTEKIRIIVPSYNGLQIKQARHTLNCSDLEPLSTSNNTAQLWLIKVSQTQALSIQWDNDKEGARTCLGYTRITESQEGIAEFSWLGFIVQWLHYLLKQYSSFPQMTSDILSTTDRRKKNIPKWEPRRKREHFHLVLWELAWKNVQWKVSDENQLVLSLTDKRDSSSSPRGFNRSLEICSQ